MEKRALTPHPQSAVDAPFRIVAAVDSEPLGRLQIAFSVAGPIASIRWPEAAQPARKNGLWRSTCFEAFLRGPAGGPYYEFNFSPSGEWAAYRFTSRREGMCEAEEISPPRIETARTIESFILRATIEPGELHRLRHERTLKAGLSAVIEGASGAKSYWALAHQPGDPDFHDPLNHILEIYREPTA